jgi:predicted membrane chloride channel (bestrophin family)
MTSNNTPINSSNHNRIIQPSMMETTPKSLPLLSLIDSMKEYEDVRTAFFKLHGTCQMEYTKSNDPWLATLLIIRGRALDHIIFPWTIIMIYTIIYTIIQEIFLTPSTTTSHNTGVTTWDNLFSFVLTSTLSLLLVFRLNRAAGRFWSARIYWGDIVAQSRTFVSGVIRLTSSLSSLHNHTDDDQHLRIIERDHSIRWMIAFTITTMELLRGEKKVQDTGFLGILTQDEVRILNEQFHPPMYAIDRARYHLNKIWNVVENKNASTFTSHTFSNQLTALENQLNVMVWSGG